LVRKTPPRAITFFTSICDVQQEGKVTMSYLGTLPPYQILICNETSTKAMHALRHGYVV
jgi:hypothetical protein